jgi:hypothetical protein
VSTEDGGAPQGRTSPVTDGPSAKASKATEQHIDLRDLATILAPDDSVWASVIKGTVTVVELTGSPPTITIQVSGDTSVDIPGVRFIDSYSPVIGDTVLLVKQGSEIFALGQMNSTTTAPSENGWVTPSLGSGVTAHSIDPVRYRVVVRDGDRVVQLRGGVTLSGTQTALWTMPADVRPVVNLLPLLCARNPDGGSNVAQLQANGSMVLAGATTSPTGGAASEATTGTSSIGTTVNSFVLTTSNHNGHSHWINGDGNHPPPNDRTEHTGDHNHTVPAHGHGMAHTHEHPHTHTNTVDHPDWLSFNGIEYIL